jgi:hypothetical protein
MISGILATILVILLVIIIVSALLAFSFIGYLKCYSCKLIYNEATGIYDELCSQVKTDFITMLNAGITGICPI